MHEFHLPSYGLSWNNFTQYADRLDRIGLGLNLAPLVAHGPLRIAILGAEDRIPSDKELERIKHLTIKKVTQDIQPSGGGHFNTAIASINASLDELVSVLIIRCSASSPSICCTIGTRPFCCFS
jgi:N-acyl-D-amino-acid deacylase